MNIERYVVTGSQPLKVINVLPEMTLELRQINSVAIHANRLPASRKKPRRYVSSFAWFDLQGQRMALVAHAGQGCAKEGFEVVGYGFVLGDSSRNCFLRQCALIAQVH